jgi:hypothetical protein
MYTIENYIIGLISIIIYIYWSFISIKKMKAENSPRHDIRAYLTLLWLVVTLFVITILGLWIIALIFKIK